MNPRFEELYERFVDGTLDAGEREEFLRLLEDPRARRHFVELQAFEVAVSEELRLGPVQIRDAKAASSRTLPRVKARPLSGTYRATPRSGAPWLWGAGVAAAFLVIVALALNSGSAPPKAPAALVRETRVSTPPEPPPKGVPPRTEPSRAVLPGRELRDPEPFVVPPPKPAPLPDPPKEAAAPRPPEPKPSPVAAPSPVRESVAHVARLEAAGGEVLLSGLPAKPTQGLVSGQSLSTGREAYALLRFEDGTRLELGPDTKVSRVGEGPAGKFVQVDSGTVHLDVGKQPQGKPLIVGSPQAECTVLGTQFTVKTTPAYARIDVREGRVKVARLPQAVSTVVVPAGQFLMVGQGYDFVPKPQPANWKAPGGALAFWLKSDAGVKLNAGAVAAWQDQSPSGTPVAALNAAAQPEWVPAASGGRPALRFDGADDALQLPDGFSDLRAGLSVYVVVRPAAGGPPVRFLDLDEGPQCDTVVFGGRDTPDKLSFWVYANSQTKSKVEAPGAIVAGQLQTFGAVLYPGGRVTLTRNGVVLATGQTTMPAAVVRKPNQIGRASTGDAAFKGELYEMLVYTRALNDAERGHVEGYFAGKYGDVTAPGPLLRPSDK